MSKCEWDATTPYHCLTHNTQWLDDESDRCEYKRMCDAEAAIARVRDVCDRIWDDARYAHKYGFLEVVREVRYALEGDSRVEQVAEIHEYDSSSAVTPLSRLRGAAPEWLGGQSVDEYLRQVRSV